MDALEKGAYLIDVAVVDKSEGAHARSAVALNNDQVMGSWDLVVLSELLGDTSLGLKIEHEAWTDSDIGRASGLSPTLGTRAAPAFRAA